MSSPLRLPLPLPRIRADEQPGTALQPTGDPSKQAQGTPGVFEYLYQHNKFELKVKYRPGPRTCPKPKEEERDYTDALAEVAASTKGRGPSE